MQRRLGHGGGILAPSLDDTGPMRTATMPGRCPSPDPAASSASTSPRAGSPSCRWPSNGSAAWAWPMTVTSSRSRATVASTRRSASTRWRRSRASSAEGHNAFPGAFGENLTLEGIELDVDGRRRSADASARRARDRDHLERRALLQAGPLVQRRPVRADQPQDAPDRRALVRAGDQRGPGAARRRVRVALRRGPKRLLQLSLRDLTAGEALAKDAPRVISGFMRNPMRTTPPRRQSRSR